MPDIDESADDALEETRQASTTLVGNNPLPEDNDRPAADAANPSGAKLSGDHQLADTQNSVLDDGDQYEEGLPGATESGEINGKSMNPGD